VVTGVYQCPHCGEEVDTWPDPGAGHEQQYVEDCPVCCRPNMIFATFSPDEDGFVVTASAEI
jgi:rubrerythrin